MDEREYPRTTSVLFRSKDEWLVYSAFLDSLKKRPIPESFTNWVHRNIKKEMKTVKPDGEPTKG